MVSCCFNSASTWHRCLWSSLPPASIRSHPVLQWQGNICVYIFFLPLVELARGWVRGARQDEEWKWQLLGAGLRAASPQGYSCEAAWGTRSHPFAGQMQEESRRQHLSNILAASFSATCSDHWGAVRSAPTCRFRNKEGSVKVFCRGSPTLWFFPLCNRLFLVCLLALEITSLSALDDFHNIHCDSEFQCSG